MNIKLKSSVPNEKARKPLEIECSSLVGFVLLAATFNERKKKKKEWKNRKGTIEWSLILAVNRNY